MECIVLFFIGLHLNNVRLYHKKDSNILYIIRDDDARRPLLLVRDLLLLFLFSSSSTTFLCSFLFFLPFLILHLHIRLRFNYKVRYVSGSPGIVLHTISLVTGESEMHGRGARARFTSFLDEISSFATRARVQRNARFRCASCSAFALCFLFYYLLSQPPVAYVNSSISLIGTSF